MRVVCVCGCVCVFLCVCMCVVCVCVCVCDAIVTMFVLYTCMYMFMNGQQTILDFYDLKRQQKTKGIVFLWLRRGLEDESVSINDSSGSSVYCRGRLSLRFSDKPIELCVSQ